MFIIIRKKIDINCRDNVTNITYLLMKNSPRHQLHRCNVPPNHRPACSSISQQRFHPRAGHDSSKDKGQCRITHSQGTRLAKPTPLGLSGHPHIGQTSTVRRPTIAYQQQNNPSQPCEEAKMTKDNPKKR